MRVELATYDPAWVEAFDQVESIIRAALGRAALLIEHVGSTAVPELRAKAIIDVVLGVDDSSDEAAYLAELENAGFRLHLREPDWHKHRVLKLEDPTTNLHVFSLGCEEIDRMVAFRNLLRIDNEARAIYESKKRDLTEREWERVQDYADAKTEVVETLLGLVKSDEIESSAS